MRILILSLFLLLGFIGKAQPAITGNIYESYTILKSKKSFLNNGYSGVIVIVTDYFVRIGKPMFITYYADSIYSTDKNSVSFMSSDIAENKRVDVDMVRVGSGAILMYIHSRDKTVYYNITVTQETGLTGKKLLKYLKWE